ncbi:hypothetical protein C1645_812934 [Glomus cerebriforme]|uniref:Uncharacterized protein n=1 Tax=Glomus cerebriforme TaxID=658196 RepID=A0A397TTW3_9GLOM|nr:hypothetical protein C1645_812934 [Glomus cerebriforme]
MLSKILSELQDIFKNYSSKQSNTSNHPNPFDSSDSSSSPSQKMNIDTNTANDDNLFINFETINFMEEFNYMSIEQAVEAHKNNSKDMKHYVSVLMLMLRWIIQKQNIESLLYYKRRTTKLSAELFKEAADYGNEVPDTQIRYATMVMQEKVELGNYYIIKAASKGYEQTFKYCDEKEISYK